ncbi:MAG TPA: NAD(+)/NADH kinase [Anaerolineae bacterium]|nr:NAD(+)/NADH kinase [Anaerolineae bacterium]
MIGILYSSQVPRAKPLTHEISQWLTSRNVDSWVSRVKDMASKCELVARSSLIVVLGGDGTTLTAAREVAPFNVPVFGVNLGRVGFLSEVTPEAWQSKLERVLDGDYWLERRLMLKGEVWRDGAQISNLSALNDIVVSRGEHVRVVRFHLFVDADHVTTYTADGLIASTPTGSTAYSMAAGGPLLPPQLKNFLIIPVAPHLSFERPVVLHQEAVVKIQVEMVHRALATADGQDEVHLQSGDEVLISKHQNEGLFARVDGQSYFYHRLMQRLSFWSRKQ